MKDSRRTNQNRRVSLVRFDDGEQLLTDVETFLSRFVVLPVEERLTLALWVFSCWAATAFDTVVNILITSPAPQCGKSLLMDVLNLLVPRPRMIAGELRPSFLKQLEGEPEPATLLVDDADLILSSRSWTARTLVAALVSGQRRKNKAGIARLFGVAALAATDPLPPSVRHKLLPLCLRRRLPSEEITPFSRRDAALVAEQLRARLAGWADRNSETLATHRSVMPEGLSDRQEDAAQVLLSVAEQLGDGVADDARQALGKILHTLTDASLGERLLGDTYQIFLLLRERKILTSHLVSQLVAIETSPWADMNGSGQKLTATGLARLLRPFKITPRTVRPKKTAVSLAPSTFTKGRGKGDTGKGYLRDSFLDAWQRYVPDFDLSALPAGEEHE